MTKRRDYDLEVSDLLKQFEPYSFLIEECAPSYTAETNPPVVTLRWVDNTTESKEEENANS